MKKFFIIIVCSLFLNGCLFNMSDQPRYSPYEKNNQYPNKMASRPIVEGTIARGTLEEDEHFFQGKIDGKIAETFPDEVNKELLILGQERYNIYCSVCHDKSGYGQGMIVQRGFIQPPSFHDDRLRNAPPGYFFNIITNGFGRMFSYEKELTPKERWAVTAYIKALQLSQNLDLNQVSENEKNNIIDQIEKTKESHS